MVTPRYGLTALRRGTRAGEQRGTFGVIAAGLFLGGKRFVHVQAADQRHRTAERFQRFGDKRKVEIRSLPAKDSSSRERRHADARFRETV
jgi:hypothetical protein